MYWNDHDMNGWNWFAMSIGTFLFWALLVAVGVLLYRTLSRPHPTPPTPPGPAAAQGTGAASTDTAERLLAERFARGEIDEEEYRRRVAVLRAHGPGLTKT